MRRTILLRLVLPVVVALVLVGLASEGVPGLFFGWAALGYLLWRAWPGITRDVRRLAAASGWGKRVTIHRPSRVGDL